MYKKQDNNSKPNTAPLLSKEGWLVARRDGVVKIYSLPHLKTFRTTLRHNLTPAEAFLWKQLQNSKFEKQKFRRQHSIGKYIVDFYCPSQQLAIELDGEVHSSEEARLYDKERDLFMEHFGIKVLRFENKRVFDNLESVLAVIKEHFII